MKSAEDDELEEEADWIYRNAFATPTISLQVRDCAWNLFHGSADRNVVPSTTFISGFELLILTRVSSFFASKRNTKKWKEPQFLSLNLVLLFQ